MLESALGDIGLSRNEVKVYLALLGLGPSLVGMICSKAKVHRRNVYDSLEMLRDKGFVSSTVINNRNVFEAVNPKRILDILDEKKAGIQSVLPLLLSQKEAKNASVRVYSGLAGRKVVFEDKLNCRGEQLVLGAHEPSARSSAFVNNYHLRRIAKHIHLRMLFAANERAAAVKFRKYKFVRVRLLPDCFSSPIAINIYANKVALLLGSDTAEPVSILIEDKGLADSFRAYFARLWKVSRAL